MTKTPPEGPPPGAVPLITLLPLIAPADVWGAYKLVTSVQPPRRKAAAHLPFYLGTAPQTVRHKQLAAQARRLRADLKALVLERLLAGTLIGFVQDPPPFGPWRIIPAHAWRQMTLESLEHGRVRSPDRRFADLHVQRSDLDPEISDHLPVGAPGRPSKGIGVVRAEFKRRAAAGLLAPSLAAQSRELAAWYKETYPPRPAAHPKTIENDLRPLWQAIKHRPGSAGPTTPAARTPGAGSGARSGSGSGRAAARRTSPRK